MVKRKLQETVLILCSFFFVVLKVHSSKSFPLLVHQLWTPGGEPDSAALRNAMAAWKAAQPDIKYTLWNDSTAESVLQRHAGKLAVEAYYKFPPAQKKDFFMYVVLAELGGLFVDCDVWPLQPPGRWLREFAVQGDEVLLGLEARGTQEQQELHRWGGRTQVTVWTVASVPNSTLMREAAYAILRTHQDNALASDYMSTIKLTGPGLLTRVLESFLAEYGSCLEAFRSISGSLRSDAIARVRIVSIDVFGCGQPHSGSRSCKEAAGIALVRHEFAGTWKWKLCTNAIASEFVSFARMQGWEAEDWFDDLQQQYSWTACGPPSDDSSRDPLRPLFAPAYPPLLPRPPPRCDRICALLFDLLLLPPLLAGPSRDADDEGPDKVDDDLHETVWL